MLSEFTVKIGLLNSIVYSNNVSIDVFFSGYIVISNSSVFLLLSENFTKTVSIISDSIESIAVNETCKLSISVKLL